MACTVNGADMVLLLLAAAGSGEAAGIRVRGMSPFKQGRAVGGIFYLPKGCVSPPNTVWRFILRYYSSFTPPKPVSAGHFRARAKITNVKNRKNPRPSRY